MKLQFGDFLRAIRAVENYNEMIGEVERATGANLDSGPIMEIMNAVVDVILLHFVDPMAIDDELYERLWDGICVSLDDNEWMEVYSKLCEYSNKGL